MLGFAKAATGGSHVPGKSGLDLFPMPFNGMWRPSVQGMYNTHNADIIAWLLRVLG